MRRNTKSCVLLVLVLMAAACGGGEPATTTNPPPATDTTGAGSPGSTVAPTATTAPPTATTAAPAGPQALAVFETILAALATQKQGEPSGDPDRGPSFSMCYPSEGFIVWPGGTRLADSEPMSTFLVVPDTVTGGFALYVDDDPDGSMYAQAQGLVGADDCWQGWLSIDGDTEVTATSIAGTAGVLERGLRVSQAMGGSTPRYNAFVFPFNGLVVGFSSEGPAFPELADQVDQEFEELVAVIVNALR